MVKQLSEYQWSSHVAYLGDEVLPWLEPSIVLSRFSDRLNRARERYIEFMSAGMSEPHRAEFHRGASDVRILGDDDFAEKVLVVDASKEVHCGLDDCIEIVCQFYELQPSTLSDKNRMRKPSEARAIIAWLVRKYGSVTLTDIARKFGRDVATISTAVRRLEEKVLESDDFRHVVSEIETALLERSNPSDLPSSQSVVPKRE